MSSNVVRMPPQPSQQGWMWNGSNWCWSPDFDDCPPCPPCPPSGFPTPCPPWCPPWFPPPAGQAPWYPGANGGVSFSAAPPVNPIRGNFWWDGTMLHLFDGAVWVNIGPGAASGGGSGSPGSKTWIQATAPPSPALGDTWWDGTQFRVWDGTAWDIVGPGATVGPVATTTQAFQVMTATATSALSATTWQIAPINGVPSVDPYTGWTAASHQFKPNKAGWYAFLIQAYAPIVAGGYYAISLLRNDSGVGGALLPAGSDTICTAANSNPDFISAFALGHLNGTTDFVRLWVYTAAAAAWNAGSSNMKAWLLP